MYYTVWHVGVAESLVLLSHNKAQGRNWWKIEVETLGILSVWLVPRTFFFLTVKKKHQFIFGMMLMEYFTVLIDFLGILPKSSKFISIAAQRCYLILLFPISKNNLKENNSIEKEDKDLMKSI